MNTIIISVEDVSRKAEVFDTPTGRAILAALPFESTANVWGDEIYFRSIASRSNTSTFTAGHVWNDMPVN